MKAKVISTMSVSRPLALNAQAVYGDTLAPDEPMSKHLQKILTSMQDKVKLVQAAQGAISDIHIDTLLVASATLAHMTYVRAALQVYGSSSMFDEFEHRQRLHLLVGLKRIADAATCSIIAEVCRDK